MKASTYQTVNLTRGRHSSPERGVCVMELASMLAGERFTDHPKSVCPVIAAFLRTYNDHLDDERRQQLYPFASASVGTRSTPAVEGARARLCAEWIRAQMRATHRHGIWALFRLPLMPYTLEPSAVAAARLAARKVMKDAPEAQAAVRALVARMIACGEEATLGDEAATPPAAGAVPAEV